MIFFFSYINLIRVKEKKNNNKRIVNFIENNEKRKKNYKYEMIKY